MFFHLLAWFARQLDRVLPKDMSVLQSLVHLFLRAFKEITQRKDYNSHLGLYNLGSTSYYKVVTHKFAVFSKKAVVFHKNQPLQWYNTFTRGLELLKTLSKAITKLY
jgi:hypothetical protein